jgi:hypothetical protein
LVYCPDEISLHLPAVLWSIAPHTEDAAAVTVRETENSPRYAQ